MIWLKITHGKGEHGAGCYPLHAITNNCINWIKLWQRGSASEYDGVRVRQWLKFPPSKSQPSRDVPDENVEYSYLLTVMQVTQ